MRNLLYNNAICGLKRVICGGRDPIRQVVFRILHVILQLIERRFPGILPFSGIHKAEETA